MLIIQRVSSRNEHFIHQTKLSPGLSDGAAACVRRGAAPPVHRLRVSLWEPIVWIPFIFPANKGIQGLSP